MLKFTNVMDLTILDQIATGKIRLKLLPRCAYLYDDNVIIILFLAKLITAKSGNVDHEFLIISRMNRTSITFSSRI